MTHEQVGLVIFAKEIQRVAEFYQSVLGLELKINEEKTVRLESGCLQLVIHNIPKPVAAKITITTPPKRRSNTAIKPVFFIDDMAEARQLTTRHGGELNPQDKEWNFENHKVCDGFDCEGNVFQLRAPVI